MVSLRALCDALEDCKTASSDYGSQSSGSLNLAGVGSSSLLIIVSPWSAAWPYSTSGFLSPQKREIGVCAYPSHTQIEKNKKLFSGSSG
jgi:hypothetical protein